MDVDVVEHPLARPHKASLVDEPGGGARAVAKILHLIVPIGWEPNIAQKSMSYAGLNQKMRPPCTKMSCESQASWSGVAT